jgi:hypothetical protein
MKIGETIFGVFLGWFLFGLVGWGGIILVLVAYIAISGCRNARNRRQWRRQLEREDREAGIPDTPGRRQAREDLIGLMTMFD